MKPKDGILLFKFCLYLFSSQCLGNSSLANYLGSQGRMMFVIPNANLIKKIKLKLQFFKCQNM